MANSVGSVLVVGGGVAGMRASLDLANGTLSNLHRQHGEAWIGGTGVPDEVQVGQAFQTRCRWDRATSAGCPITVASGFCPRRAVTPTSTLWTWRRGKRSN